MGIDRETLKQLHHLLRPIGNRITNLVARGVVRLANDAKKLQLLQIDFDGGPADDAENFQPYGLSSVPLDGAEHLTLFLDGDGARPITIAVTDRRYRPTGGQPGEVTIYNNTGAKATFTKDGDIEVQPAVGRHARIRSASGVDESTIKADTYRSAEDTMLTAVQALLTALATSAPAPGTAPQMAATAAAATAAATAIATFQAAAVTYKSTIAKVE